jgi:hypothetical protein
MNTNTMTVSRKAGLAMCEHARRRGADVRAFRSSAGAFAAFGVVPTAVMTDVQGTGVSAYGDTTDFARIDVVPGILAWSPPI